MPDNRNLTLTIGGRNHVISIEPDEEQHVLTLAAMIDDRVRTLGLVHGQTEARMLLIAALMLADELHSLHTAPAPPPSSGPPAPAPIAPEIVARVAQLADRVEKLAARLEQSDDPA
jgi:cell division protein ZapA